MNRGPELLITDRVVSRWGWPLGIGVLFLVLGVVPFVIPVATSAALALLMGLLLLASGIVQGIHAIKMIRDPGRVGRVIWAALSLIAGMAVLRSPGAGMVAITLALAVFFLASGISKGMLAVEIRPAKGWSWLLLSAGVSLALGIYVMVTLPISSLVVPAVIFGMDLIFSGIALIAFALTLRSVHRTLSREPEISEERDRSRAA